MSFASMVKRANAKGAPEESVALRVAVGLAVLAATGAALSQGVGGAALRVAATAGIAAGFVHSHRARHADGYLLKAGLAVGVVVAFASFLSSMQGIGPSGVNQLQVPLAELFLWVQVLHSLDVPARRDLLFSLLSSLVLIAVAGVLSTSSALGPFLLVWAVAGIAGLVLSHRSELTVLQPLRSLRGDDERDGAAERRRLSRKAHRPVPADGKRLSTARLVAAVAALVLVVAGGVFALLPSAGPGRAVTFPARLPASVAVPNLGGLANPSLGAGDPSSPDGITSSTGTGAASTGYFGFADQMDTGVRGRPDDTLVLRVRAARPDFWRGQTFDRWDGRVWKQSDDRVRPTSGSAPIELGGALEGGSELGRGEELVQTVHVETSGPNLLFAASSPERVYFGDRRLFEMTDGTVRTAVHLPEGSVYTVVSRRLPVDADDLRVAGRAGSTDDPAVVARYTQLPRDVPERVTDLAHQLAAGASNRYDLVKAIEAWMATNTEYTLDIPPLPAEADAVEQFLFEDRQGFCEQIASALVVMLRSQGVPARLAVGYTPGQRNPFTGMFEVRARDAHAWAEVWFPGVGWQSFDPTASVPLAGDSYSSAAAAGLFGYLGSVFPDVSREGRVALLAVALIGGPATFLVRTVQRSRRRREADAARPWPARALDRLERLGEAAGRPRRESEPASSYASVLVTSVLPDARIVRVAELIEQRAYAGASAIDRVANPETEGDRLLTELEQAASVPA